MTRRELLRQCERVVLEVSDANLARAVVFLRDAGDRDFDHTVTCLCDVGVALARIYANEQDALSRMDEPSAALVAGRAEWLARTSRLQRAAALQMLRAARRAGATRGAS